MYSVYLVNICRIIDCLKIIELSLLHSTLSRVDIYFVCVFTVFFFYLLWVYFNFFFFNLIYGELLDMCFKWVQLNLL